MWFVSVGRAAAAKRWGVMAWNIAMVEESPGSMKTWWRLTAAGGDPRESATENKPPPTAQAAGGKGETGR